VRLSAPFYLPSLLLRALLIRADNNLITRRKSQMTGIMNCVVSKQISLQDIKDLSKKMGVTINDVVTCSITTAFKKFFEKQGEI